MKKESGITLVELVIAIIIMIIIATIAFTAGTDVTDQAKITKAYNEVKAIRDAIENSNMLMEIERERGETNPKYTYEYFTTPEEEGVVTRIDSNAIVDSFGDRLSVGIKNELKNGIAGGKIYYLISYKYKRPLERLGLKKVESEYIVNFNTNEIILLGGITKDDTTLYRYEDIVKIYESLF